MSPVSRRRKSKRTRKSGRDAPRMFEVAAPAGCDCPSCSGDIPDPQALIDVLVASVGELYASTDLLELEMLASTVLAIGGPLAGAFEEALVQGFIPGFEARADKGAVAMLSAIAAVAEERAAAAASAAVGRLVAGGLERPGWATELESPLTVSNCSRLADSAGTASFLNCTFQRAGRGHSLLIHVDELDCGAAVDILVLEDSEMSDALGALRGEAVEQGVDIVSESLDPEEFRWQVERALDARAVHDLDLGDDDATDLATQDGGPGYGALAVLVRARMRALPKPEKAPAPHGDGDDSFEIPARESLAQLARGGNPSGGRRSTAMDGRASAPALPAKRKRSAGPAPVYQIKVGLRGATPPIWRRLEVSADITLARLHTIIQIAFGWDDSHLHAFETPYGRFGGGEPGPGDRAETSVTLEQVAPVADSKLRYTYDFGDDWEHDILVEKMIERATTTSYPRCTGGRRASPPEDCGGVWGYEELLQVLNDPSDDGHLDRLEWLGLDDGAQFDPARFNAAEVTRALRLVQ